MPYYWGRLNRLGIRFGEDGGRLFQRLMRDPVTVISEHDDPGEKAYLASTFRLNRGPRVQATSSGSDLTSRIVDNPWKREIVSDPNEWRLAERDLGALLDLCGAIDGESGARHHRYERQKAYGEDISWYERPEAETEIRAFASAVVDELDRRTPNADQMERLFIAVESYETRLVATGEMRYRPVDEP